MYTQVKFAGRPLHPLLVVFPLAFYSATLVGHAMYAADRGIYWFRFGHVCNWAGLITALLVAAPGFIDWQLGIQRNTAAKRVGFMHLVANVVALILFGVNVLIQDPVYSDPHPPVGVSVLLPTIGLFLTVVGGLLGWRLMHVHQVGSDSSAQAASLEPSLLPSARPDRTGHRIQRHRGLSAA